MKKTKIPSIVIASREAMAATVNDIVTARLRHAELTAQMEQEIAAVQKRYQDRLADLGREIQSKEAGVQLYCEQHRAIEFTEKKSIDLTLATVGFRETPYRVEKIRSKDTWEEIAVRMASISTTDAGGAPVFSGENYVTYPEPTLAKALLLQDRPQIPEDILKAAGIRFAYDELFYIAPKSQLAGDSVKEAA
jgi:phage host-nuclease inhibitor protein Gam